MDAPEDETDDAGTDEHEAGDDEAGDDEAGDDEAGAEAGQHEAEDDEAEPPPARRSRPGARAVARSAVEQLVEMTGRSPEGVTSVARHDDGWTVEVEVVESHRIPDSADVLGVYQAELDRDGELMSYRRVRRYNRGTGGDE